MSVSELITEMQAVKAEYPTLELDQIVQMFNIDALKDLTKEIKSLRITRW